MRSIAPSSNSRLSGRNVHHLSACNTVRQASAKRVSHVPHDSNKGAGIADDLTDFVLAGRKLRKWYGQPERGTERNPSQDGEEPNNVPDGDAVLVTDAETPTGEMVIMQLILSRARVKMVAKDADAARTAYGSYVEVLPFDIGSAGAMKSAMQGASTLLCLGRLGALLPAAKQAGLRHIVLLSAAGTAAPSGFSFAALLGDELSPLRDDAREAQVAASGVAYSIVRCASVKDIPGGQASMNITQTPGQGGSIGREDLASVLCNTLLSPPSSGRVFQVSSGGAGTMPDDWEAVLSAVREEEA